MNSELTLNLTDFETLLTKSPCACHIINPHKTRLILWKEEKDQTLTYYLRIGIQKFISYPLTDKNGEIYWKFKVDAPKSESQPLPNSADFSEGEAVTKFREREAKRQDKLNQHGKANSPEPAIANSPTS